MLICMLILISCICWVKSHTCRQVGETQLDCTHLNLLRVPKNLPINTTRLDLSYNSITILYNGDFKHLSQLEVLELGENPLTAIQSSAFKNLSNLQSMIMIGHKLNYTAESIPDDVFKPLRSLVTLAIRSDIQRFAGNYPVIRDIPFGKLTNLVDLNIDTTPFIVFGYEFSNMKKLQSLKVGKEGSFLPGLSEVTNATFTNFPATVETINFDACELTLFESGSLLPFTFLKTFHFNSVQYGPGSINDIIKALSVYEGKNMSTIAISTLYTDSLHISQDNRITGHILTNICVENLQITNDHLIEIDFDRFILFPALITNCIKSFEIQENLLTGKMSKIALYLLWRFKNLEILNLSKDLKYASRYLKSLLGKDIRSNDFPVPIPIFLPPKLKYLDVSGVIHIMDGIDVFIFGGENMRFLNMSYCGMRNMNVSFKGLENLETLDFSVSDLSPFNVDFFKDFPNLKTLKLAKCRLDNEFMFLNGNRLFTPLTRLNFLDLSQNDLVFLSDDIFEPLKNILEIDLTDNKLIKIPDMSTLLHLQHLRFGYNSLTTINQDRRQMLDKISMANLNFSLSIYGNIFSCSCSSIELLIWFKETSVALDGRNYTCISENGELATTASLYEDLIFINRRCRSSFWLNIALCCFFITIVCIISSFVFAKNRMKIRLFLYRILGHNICPRQRHEFKYDLSIIHDESDYCRRFVLRELKNELATARGINVNLDLGHGGHNTNLAVAEDIRDSWKIVLIITERFLQSNVCLFTMCNCLSAITLTTPNRILLFIEGRPIIPNNVHFFMDSIADENIFHVELRNPLGNEFWSEFTRRLLREEIRN